MSELALTLDNCDREPIHVPGSIQPHGLLLACDAGGRLTHASANAAALLAGVPAFGKPLSLSALGGDDDLQADWETTLEAIGSGDVAARAGEIVAGEQRFDAVMHAYGGHACLELELRAEPEGDVQRFAQLAYRAIDLLKRQKTIERVLEEAVQRVRSLTGFDRVMAYRFLHDDSGEVVAEAADGALDPYLGRRYPASDIPAQARRLYTLSTLRFIADTEDVAVPLQAMPGAAVPLDQSYGVLRSVSPIHIEYLRNMGVRASMSVSIVVGGRLWGMLACHHMTPKRVSYPIRMAVDVLAQTIASRVQSLQSQSREAALAQAVSLRTELIHRIAQGTEVAEALLLEAPALCAGLHADAMLAVTRGVPHIRGEVDPAWAQRLADWLGTREGPVEHVTRADALPPWDAAVPREQRWCGLLALRFDPVGPGWIVFLRREQELTIKWGGRPDKEVAHGPLGPRLTPRGSFDEWRQVVRDTATPWNETELAIASQLLDSVARAHTERTLQIDQLRSQLWAVLGHDLRDPLQSLSIASRAMERGQPADRLTSVVKGSTQRMSQLLGQVLDLSRLQNGMTLSLALQRTDVSQLVEQLAEESRFAHATTEVVTRLTPALHAEIDPGRFAQLVSNLLSNARHHGQGRVEIETRSEADELVLTVANPAPPIPPEVVATLFEPFKPRSAGNPRNATGMGLGLYISHQVVLAHRGRLRYVPGDGTVTFEARVPLVPARPPAA